jgi:hypothetical protein
VTERHPVRYVAADAILALEQTQEILPRSRRPVGVFRRPAGARASVRAPELSQRYPVSPINFRTRQAF